MRLPALRRAPEVEPEDVELLGPPRYGTGRVAPLRKFRARRLPRRWQRRLTPFEQRELRIEGLGRLRIGRAFRKVGKGLKKVVKSKAFKYAAIATATYFTGGAALKYGAPALKRLAQSRSLRQLGKVGVEAATARAGGVPQFEPDYYGQSSQSSMFPGLSPSSYGGGGGGGGGYGGGGDYGAESGEPEAAPEEGAQPPAGPQLAGMGGSTALLLGGGLLLAMFASGSRGGRRRRR